MKATDLAKWEGRVAGLATKLPAKAMVMLYSKGRLEFLQRFYQEVTEQSYSPSENLSRTLWGLDFQGPIMNSAGMFKDGNGYGLVAEQGAGGYLAGTGTWNERKGNEKDGIYLPFAPYRKSHSASNWLGLPNKGDEANSAWAQKLMLERRKGCPIGWSVMGSPDFQGDDKLQKLVDGMKYYAHAGVDFLEINESCPNTSHGSPQDDDLANRLRYVKENFLEHRDRRVPVIVKFSNDTDIQQVPALLDLLFVLGYDGVNFGNTSIDYSKRRQLIDPKEQKGFDYFTQTFGGGVSGRPLREDSLALSNRAVEYVRKANPSQEFHVIRTGGIETAEDVRQSLDAGISLCQWYTGYFHNFSQHGHDVYKKLYEELAA